MVTISLDHTVRVRFAPSPTGTLHIGSARTALYNFLVARHAGGAFVVRIEDTDAARSEERFERAILDDLAWLGLDWDEGPDRGGPYGPYRQAERVPIYRRAADDLVAAGLAYPCFCSQERLDTLRAAAHAAGRPPRYDGRCRALEPAAVQERLAAGEPAALRFAVPAGDVRFDDVIRGPITIGSEQIGDFIILRSDHLPSYNFAAVVDDAAMAITHVIRGDDHLTNTARQELLRRALYPGAAAPVYAHHAMILAPDGGKLSKRHGATAVGDYRSLGYLPQAIVNYLALLSWSHGDDEVLGIERLVAELRARGAVGQPGDLRHGQARLAEPPVDHGLERRRPRAPGRRAPAGRHPGARGSRHRRRRQVVARALRRRAPGRRPAARAPHARRRDASGRRRRRDRSPSSPTCAAPRRRPTSRASRRASCSASTAAWARSVRSARASCSCRCAWR